MTRRTILILAAGVVAVAVVAIGAIHWFATPRVRGGGNKVIAYYRDPMNQAITVDHPGQAPCGMDYVPVYASDKNTVGIRIDPTVVQNIGVTTETAAVRDLHKDIRTSGQITVEEPRLFAVNTKIGGWVDKLHVNFTGQLVSRDQPLLEIYSPELVSTQEEYLQGLRYLKSLAADASAEARQGAKDLVDSARHRLLNWDIPDSAISELAARGTSDKTMILRAPASGVVLEKMVEAGQKVEAGMPLYKIADISTVWVMADIYQQDLSWVHVGQKASVELTNSTGQPYAGTVSYLSPVLDPMAKTAQARIAVRNTPAFDLKPGMFATITISSLAAEKALAISAQDVIRTGKRDVVVVSLGNGYFDPREVKLGVTAGDWVQILSGLEAGQNVVTSAQFLIDADSNLQSAMNQMSMPGMSMPAKNSKPSGASSGEPAQEPAKKPTASSMENMPGM